MKRFNQSLLLASAALVLVSLAACRSPVNGAKDAWSAQSAHPITVSTRIISGEIRVGRDVTALSGADHDRVAELASDYRARGTGKFSIAAPEGAQSSMQVAALMTNVALDEGVSSDSIEVSSYSTKAGVSDAPIVVSYSVYEATPSACGNWTQNYSYAPLNHDTPDHGCATQNNLAMMVENPRDLVTGRDQQAPDEGRRAFVLDQYRKGQITASQKDDQATGTVSEVNK